jgi:hypothetical protein
MTFRPDGARIVAYGVAVILVVMTVVIGVALPSDITFTPAELVTLALTLGAFLVLLHGVGRSRVRADEAGIEVLNGFTRHRFGWDEVVGISMKDGAPWPTLVTTDDRRINLFAIQRTDGSAADRAVARLRELAG